MTTVAGDAWQKVFGDQYKTMRQRAWEATGSLITADGSEDCKIRPQGVLMYPGPPAPGFAIPPEWMGPVAMEAAEEENEEEEEEEKEEEEEEESDTDVEEADEESDEEEDEEADEEEDDN